MYIKFEILQIVSPSEVVKMINVLGHYLRKYGIYQIENAITLGGIGFFQFLTWAKWFTRELCSMGRHDECFFPFSKHPV